MFERYKDRFAKFEADHEAVHKVRKHFEENGTIYLVAVGCFGAGYLLRKPQMITIEGAAPVFHNTIAPVISPVMNNVVNNGGYMRKIVRCLETDELWPSMSKAAEATGNSLRAMSKHIHGGTDHLDGLHYVIEGLSAS